MLLKTGQENAKDRAKLLTNKGRCGQAQASCSWKEAQGAQPAVHTASLQGDLLGWFTNLHARQTVWGGWGEAGDSHL